MTIPFEQLVILFTSLFAIFSPPAAIGAIAAICSRFSRPIQRQMAWRIAAYFGAVLITVAWIGQWLLEILGIQDAGLMVAGGIALFLAGLPFMLGTKKPETVKEQIEDAEREENWHSVAVIPLTFPISVGGASVAIVVAVAGVYDTVPDLLAISAVCVLMSLVVLATHFFAGPLAHLLGPGGMDILTRVSGIILVAIAAQILARGFFELGLNIIQDLPPGFFSD